MIEILAQLIRAALAVYETAEAIMMLCLLAVIVDWGTLERRIEESRGG